MKYAAEVQLLKTLVAGDSQRIGRQFLARQIDLSRLTEFLYDEQMGVYFLALMEQRQLLNLLPRNIREQLLWLREDQHLRNERLARATEQLQSLLGESSIDILQLKGLPLAQRYWGGTDCRFCWDLDLMVRVIDRNRAIDALEAAGCDSHLPALLPRSLVYWLSHAMEFTFADLSVDLHWVFRRRPGFAIDYEAVWSRREYRRDVEPPCWVPSAQDTLVIMLLGIAQDAERGHCRYRKLWDIYLWLRLEQNFDWEAFHLRCGNEGLAALCINMLAFTVTALDCGADFPALHAFLAARDDAISCNAVDVCRVLGRSRQHLANRLWFARLQDIPAWRYLGWWTVTAPLRYFLGRNI